MPLKEKSSESGPRRVRGKAMARGLPARAARSMFGPPG